MPRLIDADALKETVRAQDYILKDWLNTIDKGMFTVGIMYAIDEQPTVDAEPVKRGMWTFIRLTDKDYGHKAKECSSCGSTFFDTKQWNYCPNCGAYMKGIGDD